MPLGFIVCSEWDDVAKLMGLVGAAALLLAAGCLRPAPLPTDPLAEVRSLPATAVYEVSGTWSGAAMVEFTPQELASHKGTPISGILARGTDVDPGANGLPTFAVAYDSCQAPQWMNQGAVPQIQFVHAAFLVAPYLYVNAAIDPKELRVLNATEKEELARTPSIVPAWTQQHWQRGPAWLHTAARPNGWLAWWSVNSTVPDSDWERAAFLQWGNATIPSLVDLPGKTWKLSSITEGGPEVECAATAKVGGEGGWDAWGPKVEPPLPFSLRGMVEAALATPQLHMLAEYREAHPDMFLNSFEGPTPCNWLSCGLGLPVGDQFDNAWLLTFLAPDNQSGVGVACKVVYLSGEAEDPARYSCECEGPFQTDTPIAKPDWETVDPTGMAPWFRLATALDATGGFQFNLMQGVHTRYHLSCGGLSESPPDDPRSGEVLDYISAQLNGTGRRIMWDGATGNGSVITQVTVDEFLAATREAKGME